MALRAATRTLGLAVALAAQPSAVGAIALLQVDEFEDGTTQGWVSGANNPNPPVQVLDGGPAGAGDGYLRIEGNGGSGAGNSIVAFNTTRWAGDYLAAGVTAIRVDLRNLASEALWIRLLFQGPGGDFLSSTPVALAVGTGWQTALFPIDADDLEGGSDLAVTFAGVTRLRILHALGTQGTDPVLGALGVDNVTAVPEPATLAFLGLGLAAFGAAARRRGRSAPVVRALAAGVALWLAASASLADQLTLSPTQDATIFSESGATANGAGEFFHAGQNNDAARPTNDTISDWRRALLLFDVSGSIAAGSTINSVTLTLYMSRTQVNNQSLTLHRLTQSWGEGTSNPGANEGSGVAATTNDATWTQRFYNTSAWTTAGGSFVATASATTTVGNAQGFYSWSGSGLVADVQAWVDGTASNHGWLLRGPETLRSAKRFNSRTNASVAQRPALVIDFTPPVTTGACCAADGSCSVPGGATECAAAGGSYQGAGSSCTPNPCPEPTGACCLPEAAATCLEVTESECATQSGSFQGALTACADVECPVVLEPFVDALPIPALAQPSSGSSGGTASYTLTMREVQQQLHRDLPASTVWGYGDGATGASYPGPTLEAATNHAVSVTWANDLRDTAASGNPLRTSHYLAVDGCPHGAAENADARTVVHLHGAHVPRESDGHPEDTFPPGQSASYVYPNAQLPATLWYHDHALGITRLNVYMGLAGLYLVRDNVEKALGLPSGNHEIPLLIQDRSFHPDGSLDYPAAWQETFFGDTILVNGKVWPYLDVSQGKYRFRVVNGSTSRVYTLSLSNGASFLQIGGEGGLLPAPVALSETTLAPGERVDLVIDFAPYAAGTEIELENSASAPFPDEPGVGVVPDVMKFVVQGTAGHTAALPATLRSQELLEEADAAHVRDFSIASMFCDGCSAMGLGILSTAVDGVPVSGSASYWTDITELPQLGDTEVWRFFNLTGITHPMHIHLVMFQILDRQAFEVIDGENVPIGSPVPAEPEEAGWEDTVRVAPNELVRVIARFEDYAGLFPYHCHILEHEDHEMMRQMAATSACSDGLDDDGDALIDHPADPGCASEHDLSEGADCGDGLDNDRDGAIDTADSGCASASDASERDASKACDNGLDDDGDGRVDYDVVTAADPEFQAGLGDPGCRNPSWTLENPQCQDGLGNDSDGLVDFDGGASATGTLLSASPDPQCALPSSNRERPRSGCGIGLALVLLAPLLERLRRRRPAGPCQRS